MIEHGILTYIAHLSILVHQIGYDDSKGDYLIQSHDHISYRYEILEILGRGSFGQVVRAFDHQVKEMVALKIIRNKKRFATQGEIEIRILEDLKRWVRNFTFSQ
jgi:dual specificity tyrosine-phosphorylation-regulated kinase 2/3/4